ncbi:MAG: DUF1027 domain-containing protein [Firmicutes bacterium]|nr:DUF1027 domain-containing protein [Bacillota bacterium]
MKKIILDNKEYELEKNYKDGFDLDELKNKYTEYFEGYDYILGDWAYNKLRLKGFCDKKNSLFNDINDYKKIESYIKDNCAYECRYFIIKKIK